MNRGALAADEAPLAPHGSGCSQRDRTQSQLLVLRRFPRIDHRDVAAFTTEWWELHDISGWSAASRIASAEAIRFG